MQEVRGKRIILHVCHVSLMGPNNPIYSRSPSVVGEKDAVGGPSNSRGKSGEGNLPTSNSREDDEAQLNSDLMNAWMQRMQSLTFVVRR